MFGKKFLKGGGSTEHGDTKAKPKSPRDVMSEAISQLAPGRETAYRLPAMYGPDIIVVEANKDYPGKGHRYSVLSADPVDGKPGPKRRHIWESDKPKAIADWIVARSGELVI